MYRENKDHVVKFGNTQDEYESYEHGNWFYLPHSCGPWVIGNEKEAKQLIVDLQILIELKRVDK